ncbi:DUF3158 family protein [Pseudomonas aeruginosa]
MTASMPQRYFRPLEQPDFLRLEQAAYLKGLLRPFKSKGALEDWAYLCFGLRDGLIVLAQRQVLPQASGHPLHLFPVELAQQKTGAGTTFLRWRRPDRSAMGVGLWQDLISNPLTPANLLDDLLALELQRVALNMQVSVLHTLGRQALDCASKMGRAEDAYLARIKALSSSAPDLRAPKT